MKKLFYLCAATAMFFAVGCSDDYDDSVLKDRVDDLESRVTQLETLCNQMNINISSMQTILSALQEADYITSVVPVTENGQEVGYTLTFARSQSVTIYHGKNGTNGKDGINGKDGQTPIIGVRQHENGIYYWTLDGEWLLDNAGNKVCAVGRDRQNGKDDADGKDGVTPKLKIENDYWYVSYDDGSTWTQLGKAKGDNGIDGNNGTNGESMFQDVTYDNSNVYLTLADGTMITIPLQMSLSITFTPEDAVITNGPCKIEYTVTGASGSDVIIETIASEGVKVVVTPSESNPLLGTIMINAEDVCDNSRVIVLVTDGTSMVMRRILVEEPQLKFEDAEEGQDGMTKAVEIPAETEELTLTVLSNVEPEVTISFESDPETPWIRLKQDTRAIVERTLEFEVDENTTDQSRSATIEVTIGDGTNKIEFFIEQAASTYLKERAALIAFYEAANGDNWVNNTNWKSDRPFEEWYGVSTNNIGSVISINLEYNKLSGFISPELGDLTNLRILEIADNELIGEIPKEIGRLVNLERLTIYSNQLNGNIPSEIGNLTNLQFLHLYGKIPTEIGNLVNLESLYITSNRLDGDIPSEIGNLVNLKHMDLDGVTGEIPEEIGSLINLEDLRMEGMLTGGIPNTIGNLTNLRYLAIAGNPKLTGPIPAEIGDLVNLEDLWLNYNNLNGSLPEEMGKVTTHLYWNDGV